MTLLYKEIRTFYKTNQVLIKYQEIKKIRIRTRDVFIIENVHNLIKQKEIVRQQLSKKSVKEIIIQTRSSDLQHYERCNKTNHNVRIYSKIKDTFKEDNNIENN